MRMRMRMRMPVALAVLLVQPLPRGGTLATAAALSPTTLPPSSPLASSFAPTTSPPPLSSLGPRARWPTRGGRCPGASFRPHHPPPRPYASRPRHPRPRAVAPPSMIAGPASRAAAAWSLAGAAAAAAAVRASYPRIRRALWPGSDPDPAHLPDRPLPRGSLGCPLRGSNYRLATPDFGQGAFFARRSERLGNPRIWKFFGGGGPFAVVSGSANVGAVLSREFGGGVSIGDERSVGAHSIRSDENDGEAHGFLRRLVGAGVDPPAVARAMPSLREAAERRIDGVLSHGGRPVNMEAVCHEYTLDIAWKQIIGLNIEEGEVPTFHRSVQDWAEGVFSNVEDVEAREYLVSKIEARIDHLERNGPDGSTLSGMLFATDDETKAKRLTRDQIIDNTLFLILTGSETSAGTLTQSLLLLGLHPDAWGRVVREQRDLVAAHGEELTPHLLEGGCPYLDAVVRETQRLRPVFGANKRRVLDTIIVDGRQIPRGWTVVYSTYLTHALDPLTRREDGAHMDVMSGFVPERWLSDDTRPTTEFIPFGVGPRRCLGRHLAMAEMKTFLAAMARRVETFALVSPSPGEKIRWRTDASLIPVPEDGVVITISA